ncbi:MAG: hypothetical protein WA633_05940 [Stellaceae bacterium]
MSAVELRLNPADLSREMGAMRIWLDQHRFESSSFSCRDDADAVLVSLEFKLPYQAKAFAEHFGGRADTLSATVQDLQHGALDTGLSPTGIIG